MIRMLFTCTVCPLLSNPIHRIRAPCSPASLHRKLNFLISHHHPKENMEDAQKVSIPTWTTNDDYYNAMILGTGLKIVTDPHKGKGLYATRDFSKDDKVLVETALCCTQNLEDYLRETPLCGNCLVSLETPTDIIRRCTKDKEGVKSFSLPHKELFPLRQHMRCRNADNGCHFLFCSARCADAAWKSFHYVGCRGTMNESQRLSLHNFLSEGWEQGGIDYSDTHFFALRFLSLALTRHRLHRMSLEESYAPISLLIRTPITKFHFTFLLQDELTPAEKWKSFLDFKENPDQHPAVLEASKSLSKEEMLKKGVTWIHQIFNMSEEERAFFDSTRWSELLGAVLLNGQERTPNSPYTEYTEWLQKWPNGFEEYKQLKRQIGGGAVASKCHSSSKGQGIYSIGACFNHSCEPNLQILYTDANDETLVAVCIKDIHVGDECTISYINEELSLIERQQQLYEHYLFECGCRKCASQKEAEREAQEKKMERAPPSQAESEPSEVSQKEEEVPSITATPQRAPVHVDPNSNQDAASSDPAPAPVKEEASVPAPAPVDPATSAQEPVVSTPSPSAETESKAEPSSTPTADPAPNSTS
jgi:hypothetical protein